MGKGKSFQHLSTPFEYLLVPDLRTGNPILKTIVSTFHDVSPRENSHGENQKEIYGMKIANIAPMNQCNKIRRKTEERVRSKKKEICSFNIFF